MKKIVIGIVLYILWIIPQHAHAENAAVQVVKHEGMEAWLAEDSQLPIILLRLEVEGAGNSYDSKGKEGLAMISAAMLSEGSEGFAGRAFNETLDFYAIDYQASVDKDRLVIYVKTLREHLPKAMELLVSSLTKPEVTEEALQRIKTEQLAALSRMQENPAYLLERLFAEHAWGAHPYSLPAYGTPQSIATITADDVRAYITTHIHRANMQLSVAGDIDAQTVADSIMQPLQSLQEGKKVIPLPTVALKPSSALHKEMPLPQTQVRLVYEGVARQDDLFYAAYLLEHMLGGSSLSSQLGVELREKNGLVYGVSASLQQLQAASWLSIDFATKNQSVNQAIDLAKKVAHTMQHDLTEEKLAAAKDYVTGSFALATDSNAERLSYIAMMQRYGLGHDYIERRNALITKVTLAQVREVTERILGDAPLMQITVGNSAIK
jgi:zinc protease